MCYVRRKSLTGVATSKLHPSQNVKCFKIKYSRKKRGKVNRLLAGECQLHKRKGSGVILFFFHCLFRHLSGFCFVTHSVFSFLCSGEQRDEEKNNNNRWVELLCCQRWFYENGFWGKVGKERDRRRRQIHREDEPQRKSEGGGKMWGHEMIWGKLEELEDIEIVKIQLYGGSKCLFLAML